MESKNNLDDSNECSQSSQINFLPETEHDQSDSTIKLSLVEIEEFLRSNKLPPGIREYDDNPPLENQLPTLNTIEKLKKPWETEDNIKNLNFLEGDK